MMEIQHMKFQEIAVSKSIFSTVYTQRRMGARRNFSKGGGKPLGGGGEKSVKGGPHNLF